MLKHSTKKMLIDIDPYHKHTQLSHPKSLPKIKPGCLWEQNEIPTGRATMLTRISVAVIRMYITLKMSLFLELKNVKLIELPIVPMRKHKMNIVP